jgi:membrane protein
VKPQAADLSGTARESVKRAAGLRGRLERALALFKCAALYWSADNASTTGAALAFYCAFSIAPLLVILLSLAGLIVSETAAYGQIGAQLSGLFGPSTAKVLLGAVESAQQKQGPVAAVVSIVTLVIGATTVLAALQTALEIIWKSEAQAVSVVRGWVRTRLLSFGFILALGFLLLVSLTLSTALTNLRTWVANAFPGFVVVVGILNVLLSLVLVAALFTLIYRYMPTRRLPWKDVLLGGLLTAVLFDVGRWAVSLYLAHSTQPSAFGAASSFAALLLWLYYTAQIFLFGAEFTACLGGVRETSKRTGAS